MGADCPLHRRRAGRRRLRMGCRPARAHLDGRPRRDALGSLAHARGAGHHPRPAPGSYPLAVLPRHHARDGVLGLSRAVHGHRAGDHRLRHHPAAPGGEAAEGELLPLLRAGAGPVRLVLRDRARHGLLPPLHQAARPRGSRSEVRLCAPHPVLDQRHRLRDGGVPAGGGQAVVGGVVPGGLRAGAGLPGRGARRGRAARPLPRSVAVPRRDRAGLHRADPPLVLHAPHHHPAQHLLLQAGVPRRHRQDREHRGGGEPRRLQVRGVLLEAAAGFRRLRGVRPLPGRVPRLHLRQRAEPQGGHRQAQALHAGRRHAADPRRGDSGRRALGLHHLHGLRPRMPSLHRHRGHHRGSSTLSRSVRGRPALHGAPGVAEHPARGQPVGPCAHRAAQVGRGSTFPCS